MTTPITITALVENRAAASLAGEPGLSFWIEADDARVLFDTGAGAALEPNARALGVDLSSAQAVVLSHGHLDHTGGLPRVMAQAPGAMYFAHPAALERKFVVPPSGSVTDVSMPQPCAESLRDGRVRFTATTGPTEVAPGMWVTGAVARLTDFEPPEPRFFLDAEGRRADPMLDDQSLWIDTPKGLIVVCGCAHSGVVSTLRNIRMLRPQSRIRAVIGGMHLRGVPEERLDRIAEALEQLRVGTVAACHCTDEAAQAFLRERLEERFVDCRAGTRLSFD